MTLKLHMKIGKGMVTSLTDNFLTVATGTPLEAVDFETYAEEGFTLMFPPQQVPSHWGRSQPDEYLYNFKRVSPCP